MNIIIAGDHLLFREGFKVLLVGHIGAAFVSKRG